MFFKHLIFVAALLAVAYAMSIESLDHTVYEEPQYVAQLEQQSRDRRGLGTAALLVGGAVGIGAASFGLGLAKGAYLGRRYPPYPYPPYGNNHPYSGRSGSRAYASAGSSSW